LLLETPSLGESVAGLACDSAGGNPKDAFVFFKHEDESKGPQMAKRFLELAG
jgi:hypothetical protein